MSEHWLAFEEPQSGTSNGSKSQPMSPSTLLGGPYFYMANILDRAFRVREEGLSSDQVAVWGVLITYLGLVTMLGASSWYSRHRTVYSSSFRLLHKVAALGCAVTQQHSNFISSIILQLRFDGPMLLWSSFVYQLDPTSEVVLNCTSCGATLVLCHLLSHQLTAHSLSASAVSANSIASAVICICWALYSKMRRSPMSKGRAMQHAHGMHTLQVSPNHTDAQVPDICLERSSEDALMVASPMSSISGSSMSEPTLGTTDSSSIAAWNALHQMARQGGKCKAYHSRLRRTCVAVKIQHANPEDLPADYLVQLNQTLTTAIGRVAVAVSVRRGCIELMLEFVDLQPVDTVDDLSSSIWRGEPAASPSHLGRRMSMEEACSLLNHLRIPAPPPDQQDGTVLLQSLGQGAVEARYDIDSQQWRLQSMHDTEGREMFDNTGPALASMFRVEPPAVCCKQLPSSTSLSPSTPATTFVVLLRNAPSDLGELRFVASLGGGSTHCQVISSSASAVDNQATARMVVQLRSERLLQRPGLMLLECWHGQLVCGCWPVLVADNSLVVSELVQVCGARQVEYEGEMDDMTELITDLGRWVEYVQCCHLVPAGNDGNPVDQQIGDDGLEAWFPTADLAAAVASDPTYWSQMLTAAVDLLQFCLDSGMAATADHLLICLLSLGRCSFADVAALVSGDDGLSTLHRAVWSGSFATVQVALEWGQRYGQPVAWCRPAVGDQGLSALQLLAMGNSRTEEGLAEWVLATQQDAAAAWFRHATAGCLYAPSELAAATGHSYLNLLVEQVPELSAGGQAAAGQPACRSVQQPLPTPPSPRPPPLAAAAATARDGAEAAGLRRRRAPASTAAAAPVVTEGAQPGSPVNQAGSPATSVVAAATTEAAAPAVLSSASYADGLRLCLQGFPIKQQEKAYMDYVTVRSMSIMQIWMLLMVLAHLIVSTKSLGNGDTGSAIQACFGLAGYMVTLITTLVNQRLFVEHREAFLSACLLGRTTARFLMFVGVCANHACDNSVREYITTGLDVLLDGILEGTFEPMHLLRVAQLRLLDSLVLTAMYYRMGVVESLALSATRAFACNLLGVACTLMTDYAWRMAFSRASHRMAAARASQSQAKPAVGPSSASEGAASGSKVSSTAAHDAGVGVSS